MPANQRSGVLTWILGLLTLFAVVNVINALIQLNLYGSAAVTAFTIFDKTLGSVNTERYFWASASVMLLLFTATCFSIYRGLPVDPSLLQRMAKVEENLASNSNLIENTQIGFIRKIEDTEKSNEEAFHKVNMSLEASRKEVADSLEATRKEVADNIAKQNGALKNMEKEVEKDAETARKQSADLSIIKKILEQSADQSKTKKTSEQLEYRNDEKPKVNGQTKLGDFKNVPSGLATRLSNIKITNVSELLATDPFSIAAKTGELPENIAHLQAQAQLLMVPGIDEKHSELLVKCGVTSRKELANQDPVQLYRGVVGIAKIYTEQGKLPQSKVPTIEDVSSWVKQACS